MKLPPKKSICGLIILVLFGLALWAFVIEPNRLVVRDYDLKIKKWSPKLDGFKIIAISDIHGGSNFITEEKIRQIVALTNAQEADMIVLLGDYLSRSPFDRKRIRMPADVIAENLRGLKAKYGVYGVIGNHDNEFTEINLRQEFERVGIKVLENEITSIEKDGETIRILGIHDILKVGSAWTQISRDLKKLIENYEVQNGNLIVLAHNPDSIVYMAAELSISKDLALLLAGHTHGGQCRFPIIGAPIVPSEFGQKYAAGHIYDKDTDIFVTTGIGMSFLPVRFGVPPEISVLHLYAD